MRAYIEAQNDYASEDRDADGVEEFAQKLVAAKARPTASTGLPARVPAKARRATSSTRRSLRTPARVKAISAIVFGS